jgi:hypothetical protein
VRTPKTNTILALAAVMFVLALISTPTFYPAPVPVLGPDGSPLLKPDGSPVVHRDMTEFYRYNMPAFIFLGCSVCLVVWWLIRVLRALYERSTS